MLSLDGRVLGGETRSETHFAFMFDRRPHSEEKRRHGRGGTTCDGRCSCHRTVRQERGTVIIMSLPPVVSSSMTPQGDARALRERLHELLTRIADTTNTMKNWEESDGDDPHVHIEATTRLMSNIQEILNAIGRVENVVKTDQVLYQTLQECPIPLDLLDLMDCQGGLNPDCFSRGLLKEALVQLAGLKRRKLALDMLGDAIEKGMNKLNEQGDTPAAAGVKRSRDGDKGEELSEPSTKRTKAS